MTPTPEPQNRRRIDLSVTQLVSSALAAITATFAASYLGVTGTVIGAAVASVLTATGNAVYGHSLRRTGDRVREVVPAAARLGRRRGPTPASPASPARRWERPAFAAVATFAAALAVVTGFELVAGRPVSDVVRGASGSGTTLFGTATTTGPTDATPTPTTTVIKTVTPSVVIVTPTVTQTAPAVTPTPTPSTAAPAPTTAAPTPSTAAPAPTSPPTTTSPAIADTVTPSSSPSP